MNTTDTATHPAMAALHDLADDRFLAATQRLLESGRYVWLRDPDHYDVWGLIRRGTSADAAVIVYPPEGARTHGDFEFDLDVYSRVMR